MMDRLWSSIPNVRPKDGETRTFRFAMMDPLNHMCNMPGLKPRLRFIRDHGELTLFEGPIKDIGYGYMCELSRDDIGADTESLILHADADGALPLTVIWLFADSTMLDDFYSAMGK
jgi:hypothetical protein